jgi:hypothetical protein
MSRLAFTGAAADRRQYPNKSRVISAQIIGAQTMPTFPSGLGSRILATMARDTAVGIALRIARR